MPLPARSETLAASDPGRRRWLTAVSVSGGAGIAVTAVPFVASMAPSERARALGAPVEISIGALGPGELKTVEWRGKPVWVLRRTPAMIRSLDGHDDLLADPRSERRGQQPDDVRNAQRSIKAELAVLVALCTHLGCVPTFRPEPASAELGASWPGGFFCPCHGSKFDLAGRVFKNMPAPSNLEVPPHRYASDYSLVIGESFA